jgi:hypothetical protein
MPKPKLLRCVRDKVFREEENRMKEITRRLYTKPVMLGMAFLVGMALVVALSVTAKSKAAMSNYIPAGDDAFETTNNGETYHNFQASPIPANFFGPGSQQYSGLVPLEGVPLPGQGDTDTIIHRNQDVFTPGSTTITMTGLSLNSINPITVSYSGGGTESWNVHVGLSDVQASTGSMAFSDGGTFDSSLKVWPKFTFTRIPDGLTKVLDTGGGGGGFAATRAVADSNIVINPVPEPTLLPIPCRAIIVDTVQTGTRSSVAVNAASVGSCAPVTLTSTNSPWPITRPLTEQELLASHNASPPGTKRRIKAGDIAVGE